METLTRRLTVIAISWLVGAAVIGLLAPNAAILMLGTLVLGIGMILAILFYLLRSVESVQPFQIPARPTVVPSPIPAPHNTRPSEEIVPITRLRERRGL